jgi:hypothetical protein
MPKRRHAIVSSLILITVGAGFIGSRVRAAGDLTPREARHLIARLAGIQLPSDAVRVKEISTFGSSATVVAQVETAFRFVKGDNDKWRVAEIRTGDRRWEDVEMLVRALNSEKAARARAELEAIATALESYRREHGSYVEARSEAVLIDHLNPRYLARIIRVDPWHQPYQYEGGRNAYVLRSVGPDGKPDTSDDILLTNSSH